jgi:hydrogenase/urease accessory protein HupE
MPDSDSAAARSSLAWGIIAMFAWLVPSVGVLAALAGLVRGYQGRNAPDAARARLGMVLSTIALLMSAWLAGWIWVAMRNPNW